MIKPTISVNTAGFDAALRRNMETTKKDLADVLNMKGYKIALGASYFTRRADYQKMANELGVKLRTVSKGRRKGTLTMN